MRNNRQQPAEQGMTTIELVALAPLLAALLLFVVFCGRVAWTRNTVSRSARDAVRAASIALTRDDASIALETTLADNLGTWAPRCTHPPVDYSAIATDSGEGGDWDSGVIELRLTCTIPTSDLGLLGLGTKTFTAVAVAPSGQIIIMDNGNGRARQVEPNSNTIRTFITFTGFSLTDLLFDRPGNVLYFSWPDANQIYSYDLTTNVPSRAAGVTAGDHGRKDGRSG